LEVGHGFPRRVSNVQFLLERPPVARPEGVPLCVLGKPARSARVFLLDGQGELV
jgi:hypothetical protein